MRRGPLAVAATAAGLAGVLVLHQGPREIVASGPGAATGDTSHSPGSTPTTAPPTVGTTPPGGRRSAAGAAEQYGFGVLSVRVTVDAGRITDVAVTNLQTAEQYSQSLAQQVIPTLRGEVLSAQSARINAVSGATYTSEAYAYSVQSALDQLHVR